jgi:hypothetical protein
MIDQSKQIPSADFSSITALLDKRNMVVKVRSEHSEKMIWASIHVIMTLLITFKIMFFMNMDERYNSMVKLCKKVML